MEAITREEKIISGENLTPITRKELFLAKAAGQDVKTPTPITREEMFLSKISSGSKPEQEKKVEITENGATEIFPDEGYVLSKVTANVNVPTASGENKISQIVEKTIETITPTDLGNITTIGIDIFSENSVLKSVALPSTVTTIQDDAFRNCRAMTELTLPASITAIGGQVFQNNVKLATVRFEGTIEDWCNIAFGTNPCVFQEEKTIFYLKNAVGEYEAVTDVVIPNTVTVLSRYVFSGFGNLKSLIIPDSVVEIGNNAFYKCANITSLIIPNSVTTIPAQMCSECKSLESVTLPSGLVKINNAAFQYCYKLRSLTIPASVSNIENYGLYIGSSNSGKATLTFLGTIPPTIASNALSTGVLEKIIVPKGYGEAYKTATNWAKYADYIEEAAV